MVSVEAPNLRRDGRKMAGVAPSRTPVKFSPLLPRSTNGSTVRNAPNDRTSKKDFIEIRRI